MEKPKRTRFASWLSFILVGLVVAACGNTAPQRPVPPPEELLPALDAYVESAMPAWRVPGLALAIIKWADPIFAVSDVTFDIEDGRAVCLRFRVRPEFVDPLEYAFERTLPLRRRT